MYFDTICIHSTEQRETQALVELAVTSARCQHQITCKADTGAEGNVMPVNAYRSLMPLDNNGDHGTHGDLPPWQVCITSFGGSVLKQCRKCKLHIQHDDHTEEAEIPHHRNHGTTIIGLPSCRALGCPKRFLEYQIG